MKVDMEVLNFGVITMAVIFGIIQAGFILYFFSHKKRFRNHYWLIATILTLMVMLTEAFFLRSGLMSQYPHVFNLSIPFVFLLGPMGYLYIKSLLETSRGSFISVLHFIPFVFYFLYSFNFFLQPGSFKRSIYLESFHPEIAIAPVPPAFSPDPWGIQGWVVVELLSLHIFVYSCMAFYLIYKQKRRTKNISSTRINWSFYLSGMLTLGGLVLFFSQGGVIRGQVFFKSPFPHYSADLFSTIAIYLITGFLLAKTEFFKNGGKKYGKSSLSETFKKEKLKQLQTLIEDEQLYLKPDFSLKKLSEESGLSTHHISQILNEQLQCTFFELTNDYRIKEARHRLSTSEDYIKMEQLAYDLGYGSKSTFFTAFKKATGMTPSKYRETASV